MNPGISRHQFKIMKNATGLQINIFSYKLPICGHYSGLYVIRSADILALMFPHFLTTKFEI